MKLEILLFARNKQDFSNLTISLRNYKIKIFEYPAFKTIQSALPSNFLNAQRCNILALKRKKLQYIMVIHNMLNAIMLIYTKKGIVLVIAS